MQFTIRKILALTFICGLLIALYLWVNRPGNDDHNFGIGDQYRFEHVVLSQQTGATFALNSDELNALERIWFNEEHENEIDILNHISRTNRKLTYEYKLNDGFRMACDANYGRFNNVPYFEFELLGGGGGFPGDVYWMLACWDNVLSNERMIEFEQWLELKSPNAR